MLVECIYGDLSDPEAVSGSSTRDFDIKNRSGNVTWAIFNYKNELRIPNIFSQEKGSVTASKTDPFMWSVELFWNRFLFLAFVQEIYSKATSIIKRQNASVNKKSVVFFTSNECGNVQENCTKNAQE